MTELTGAWIGLVLFSMMTTAIAISGLAAPWAGGLILVLAWAKARLIFLWYLGLSDVRVWRQGILFAMALYFLFLFGFYALA